MLCFVTAFTIFPYPIRAQSKITRWIYTLSETSDAFSIVGVSADGGQIEQLSTIGKVSNDPASTLFLPEELDAFRQAATGIIDSSTIQAMLAGKLTIDVIGLVASADNQSVAVQVEYKMCVQQLRSVCYGGTRIELLNMASKATRIFWDYAFHPQKYISQICAPTPTSDNIAVAKMQWLSDNSALIISLGGDYYCFGQSSKSPVIVVPTTTPGKDFSIGTAIAWALAPESHSLNTVDKMCQGNPAKCQVAYRSIKIDLTTQTTSIQSYSLDPNLIVYPEFGIANISGMGIVVAQVPPETWGTILINPGKSPAVSILPSFDVGVKAIHPSPDSTSAFVDYPDGSLKWVTIQNGSINVQPFVSRPVAQWAWASDSSGLLAQFKGEMAFSLINKQGNVTQTVDIAGLLQHSQANSVSASGTQLKAISW
jgi:hypothetical protein